jgi:hypothetical protein
MDIHHFSAAEQTVTPALVRPVTARHLCHNCTHRAKRNIPVYIHEEKRLREAIDDKLLEEYRHNRDLEEKRCEEVRQQNGPNERQHVESFRLDQITS